MERVADLTYPHHKFGVAADGQGLAELETERKTSLPWTPQDAQVTHAEPCHAAWFWPFTRTASCLTRPCAHFRGLPAASMALKQSHKKVWEAGVG